jgi:PAS domain S-box-containing protein
MTPVIDLLTGLDLEDIRTAMKYTESDDFSTLVINSSVDGILTYDTESRYTLWNPAMERISGLRKEAVLGRCAFDVFPFLRKVGLDRAFQDALSGKSGSIKEVAYIIQETGRNGFTENYHTPLRDEFGKVVGGLAIVRETTETKRLIDSLRSRTQELENRIQALEAELSSKEKNPN